MTYRVDFTSAAARQVRSVPRPARDRLLDALGALADDPRPPDSRKLVGQQNAWRVRAGDYRVSYEIVDAALTVTVVRAGHRRDTYQGRELRGHGAVRRSMQAHRMRFADAVGADRSACPLIEAHGRRRRAAAG